MKRIVFFLFSILFGSNYIYGQIMVNGDFSINGGNVLLTYCSSASGFSGAWTFAPGSVPNWTRTFGSPNFGGSTSSFTGTTIGSPFPDCIFMSDLGGIGEGINGAYSFKQGVAYSIHICAVELTNGAAIRVVAGSGIPPSAAGNCLLYTCGPSEFCCGFFGDELCPFPPVIPSGSTTMEEIPHYVFGIGDNAFSFTPHHNYDWIAIFPFDIDPTCFAAITVKYCWVFPDCISAYWIPSMPLSSSLPVNPLNATIYTNADYINEGNPTIPVSISSSGNTIFEAGNAVVLEPNFTANPRNGYFLADIKNNCLNTDNISFCEPARDLPTRESNPKNDISKQQLIDNMVQANNPNVKIAPYKSSISDNIKKIDVFPNPAIDNVMISYLCQSSGDLEVTIKDVEGRIRYTESVTCNDGSTVQHSVDMSSFSPGVYFVDLILNDQHVVKKIVKL